MRVGANPSTMPDEKQHRLYPPLLTAARELRQPQTPAEQKLWSRLRDRQLDEFDKVRAAVAAATDDLMARVDALRQQNNKS